MKFLINLGINALPKKYRPLARALISVVTHCLDSLKDREVTVGEIKGLAIHALNQEYGNDDSRVVFKIGE